MPHRTVRAIRPARAGRSLTSGIPMFRPAFSKFVIFFTNSSQLYRYPPDCQRQPIRSGHQNRGMRPGPPAVWTIFSGLFAGGRNDPAVGSVQQSAGSRGRTRALVPPIPAPNCSGVSPCLNPGVCSLSEAAAASTPRQLTKQPPTYQAYAACYSPQLNSVPL